MDNIFFSTNPQKVLDFFISSENGQFERAEIEKATGLSKAGVNLALNELVWAGLVKRSARGRTYLYEADSSNPVVKQLKILKTAYLMLPLIKKIQPYAEKIVLFGSAARGENLPDSDIDLFILTREAGAIKIIVSKNKVFRKIQLILKTPLEFSQLQEKDPYFYKEIDRGIILYENYEQRSV